MKQSSDDAYKKLMQHLREKEDQFLKEMVGSQEYNPKILPPGLELHSLVNFVSYVLLGPAWTPLLVLEMSSFFTA